MAEQHNKPLNPKMWDGRIYSTGLPPNPKMRNDNNKSEKDSYTLEKDIQKERGRKRRKGTIWVETEEKQIKYPTTHVSSTVFQNGQTNTFYKWNIQPWCCHLFLCLNVCLCVTVSVFVPFPVCVLLSLFFFVNHILGFGSLFCCSAF